MGDIVQTFRLPQVSGTYSTTFSIIEETVRLDVDGSFPQKTASGTIHSNVSKLGPTHWIAYPLQYEGDSVWTGQIVKVFGNTSQMPHQRVRIQVAEAHLYSTTPAKMTITFTQGGPERTRKLDFVSPYFRTLELEIDRTVGSDTSLGTMPVRPFNPCFLDDRPAGLPCERISIEQVYRRAGVDVTRSGGDNVLSGLEAGSDKEWSDGELNDAMRVQWAGDTPAARWAIWLLVATQHVKNPETGGRPFGTMFDDSDQFQRQGLAVFTKRIEESIPGNSVQRNVEIHRKSFFAAIHEIAHCFNLYHAFQKFGDKIWDFDFMDLENLGAYPTITNYPEYVTDFYGKFWYRLADSELIFLRHAPESYVQMGGSKFGDQHGYEPRPRKGHVLDTGKWAVAATLQRPKPVLEFLEPAVLTLEVTNSGIHPQILDVATLASGGGVGVTIAAAGGVVSALRPFVRHCYYPEPRVLEPGASLRTTMYVSAGLDGWHLAEPGAYTLHTEIDTPQISASAAPLRLRVAHPRTRDEEIVAMDFFTKDVGRALAVGGTQVMTSAINALREAVERVPESAVARHAALTLAQPLMRDWKVLRRPEAGGAGEKCLGEMAQKPEEARRLLDQALLKDPETAAGGFGECRYRQLMDEYKRWLEQSGERAAPRRKR